MKEEPAPGAGAGPQADPVRCVGGTGPVALLHDHRLGADTVMIDRGPFTGPCGIGVNLTEVPGVGERRGADRASRSLEDNFLVEHVLGEGTQELDSYPGTEMPDHPPGRGAERDRRTDGNRNADIDGGAGH